jgi:hypothetical protein
MMRIVALAVAGALGLGAVALSVAKSPDKAAVGIRPAWSEVDWPFLMDQWGKGKAFQCKAADCGTEVKLYLRAKIGFCNCATGVSDDEELDRVADVDLIGRQFSPLAPGHAIKVGTMSGRSRPYVVAPAGTWALALAFNERCDVIAATAVIGRDQPASFEPAVLEFLNGKTVLRWAEVTLGL